MNAPDCRPVTDGQEAPLADFEALIESLRTAGADRFDPVRFHHIAALARRASAHQGSTRRMIDARLAQVLASLQERFALARDEATQTLARSAQEYAHAASELEQLASTGDVRGLQHLLATLRGREQCASLGALVRRLEQQAPANAGTPPQTQATSPVELKALRNHRNTWAKLSVDKQVAQALEQAPANAGPINSHMLVLRSLALMRDISPDYLNRFMAYADTLLCLDQSDNDKPHVTKKPRVPRTTKKQPGASPQ